MYLSTCGAGYPVLFIHGMPTSGQLWTRITDRMRDRFTCLAVDLPGLGKTPRVAYGPKQLEALAERIEQIRVARGIKNGTSWGTTLERPSRCIMLTSINRTWTIWRCFRRPCSRN